MPGGYHNGLAVVEKIFLVDLPFLRFQAGVIPGGGEPVLPEQITYTNTREVLIDTGITLETVPYMMMTAAGTLPLLRRRRKKE